jgi:hypothetical protein
VVSQAGLFSAALTAFVVDSKQDLTPNPSDEMVYYLRQHSTILSQISVQLSVIAPQVSIPSPPPPPFPVFNPSASDVHVNIFWFMALAFSLLAALLAILVQQWVRDYMHVFQRYGGSLKSARLRQYLYEGCERWYMLKVAEVVPGFLHVSLFLFFAGLAESLLNINTKVALSTILPIGISGLLYILITFVPTIYPQSPYRNSFSGIFWYLFQKSYGRRFKDHGSNGGTKYVSTNMSQGQMQLAMEETVARKGRDVRAIRWLIDNLTEDVEMEKFLSAIPGSFNTDWGTGVWKRVGEHHESEDQSQDKPVARPHRDTTHQPSSSRSIRSVLKPIIHLVRQPAPHHPPTHATTRSPAPHSPNVHPHPTTAQIRGYNVVRELSERITRSLETCKNRGLFAKEELWRRRTRECIETTASLVSCANADLSWFGDIMNLLGDLGSHSKMRELSLTGMDELFVTRWTCLSTLAIRRLLEKNEEMRNGGTWAIGLFAREDDSGNKDALKCARKIDKTLQKARGCLNRLYQALRSKEDLTEEVKEILRGGESQISELEQLDIEVAHFESMDFWIFYVQSSITRRLGEITSQFHGALDDLDYSALVPFSRFVELSRDPRKLQFIRPGQTLKSMCSPAVTLRSILEGQGDADAYKELLKNLGEFCHWSRWQGNELQRQLWRLQDLSDGGGLGFGVELFFLALSQQLSAPSSKESHSALYIGTFRAITYDWSVHKHTPTSGTQNLLLDIALSRNQEFDRYYPAYMADEFLDLLGNIFEGQASSHIDKAAHQLASVPLYARSGFYDRLFNVITGAATQALPRSF